MNCLLCGDEIPAILRLRDRDFCCSRHRQRYQNALRGFLKRTAEPDPIDACIAPVAPAISLRRIRPSPGPALDRLLVRASALPMQASAVAALRTALPAIAADELRALDASAPAPLEEPKSAARCRPESWPRGAHDLRGVLSQLRSSVMELQEALAACDESLSSPGIPPRLRSDLETPGMVRPRPYLVISRRRGAA